MKFGEGVKTGLAVALLAVLVIGYLGISLVGRKAGIQSLGEAARFSQAPLQNLDRRASPEGPDVQYIRPGGQPGAMGEPWEPPSAVNIVEESQNIDVEIEVERREHGQPPRYKIKFDGKYVLKNNSSQRCRPRFRFPFPADTDAKWNTKVLVDGEPVDDAEFGTDHVSWTMDLEPRGRRDLQIAYEARGRRKFEYQLSKAGRLPQVKVAITVRGVRVPPEVLEGTLEPSVEDRLPDGAWSYIWQYDGLVANRDIGLQFPDRRYLTTGTTLLMRSPWVPIAVTVGFVLWIGAMAQFRKVRMRPVQYVAIAACFFLFAWALVFLAELFPLDWAYAVSGVIIAGMITLYCWANTGPSFTGQYVVTALVLFLGTYGVIGLAPWLTKVCLVGALLMIVGCLMLATRGPTEEEPEPELPVEAPPPPAPATPPPAAVQPTTPAQPTYGAPPPPPVQG